MNNINNFDVIIIGHIMTEKINLSDGKIVGHVLGSPASYSSVAASLMGTKTGLVTIIGKDMPYYIVNSIIASGVNTRGLCVLG